MITRTLTLAALAALSAAALSPAALAAPAKAAPAKAAAKQAALVCPVTGNKIASASAAYNKETYHGKTYYFCCPACKPKFDKNPDKVIADAAKGQYQPM